MLLKILTFFYVGVVGLFMLGIIGLMLESWTVGLLPYLALIMGAYVGLYTLVVMSAYHADIVSRKTLQWVPLRKIVIGLSAGVIPIFVSFYIGDKIGGFVLFASTPALLLASAYLLIWLNVAKDA